MKNWGIIASTLGLPILLSACQQKQVAYQPWVPPENSQHMEEPVQSDKELMANVRSIAILPFNDSSRSPKHTLNFDDLLLFGEKFASHLIGSQTFDQVMYPAVALQELEGTALNVMRKDDLKEIGNILDADAVVFGVIHQYNMYYPPRLSLSMKFYLTRADRFASSHEISAIAHSGVPLNSYNPTFFKQLWDNSAFYDGSSSQLKSTLKHYLKTHESDKYGFQDDRFLRTKRDFIDLITYDLANSLHQKKYEKDNEYIVRPLKGKKKSHAPSGYFHK